MRYRWYVNPAGIWTQIQIQSLYLIPDTTGIAGAGKAGSMKTPKQHKQIRKTQVSNSTPSLQPSCGLEDLLLEHQDCLHLPLETLRVVQTGDLSLCLQHWAATEPVWALAWHLTEEPTSLRGGDGIGRQGMWCVLWLENTFPTRLQWFKSSRI